MLRWDCFLSASIYVSCPFLSISFLTAQIDFIWLQGSKISLICFVNNSHYNFKYKFNSFHSSSCYSFSLVLSIVLYCYLARSKSYGLQMLLSRHLKMQRLESIRPQYNLNGYLHRKCLDRWGLECPTVILGGHGFEHN